MTKLRIKAVEMVRSIRDAHYEKLKDASPQEKIAFFRVKARRLHAELGRPEEPLDTSTRRSPSPTEAPEEAPACSPGSKRSGDPG
jgi:hypothetical protein